MDCCSVGTIYEKLYKNLSLSGLDIFMDIFIFFEKFMSSSQFKRQKTISFCVLISMFIFPLSWLFIYKNTLFSSSVFTFSLAFQFTQFINLINVIILIYYIVIRLILVWFKRALIPSRKWQFIRYLEVFWVFDFTSFI